MCLIQRFYYESLKRTLILLANVVVCWRPIKRTPMLLLFISVIAPVVESNSMGMLHFLKNVSFTSVAAQSLVVPFPAPARTFNVYVLSISVRNLDLLARLLNDWKSFVSMISAEAAVAPLHCLSRYRITLTVSEFRGSDTPSDSTVAI